MRQPIRVILDCDPGHDDAIAIILAIANVSLDVVAITTVAGNVEVEKTTKNALQICEITKADSIPVVMGTDRPLIGQQMTAVEIHGESGMEGPVLPPPIKVAEKENAVDFIIRVLLESAGDVVLIPTGPLTNIALAIAREPRIKSKIREIVFMGGGTFGNWTPAAEFNIFVDAEAAKIVMESGVPITMVGLDVTHQVLANKEIVERYRRIGNPVSLFVSELLEYFIHTYKVHFNMEGGPVHDACAVAYCIDPSLFATTKVRVDVETKGEFTYGMTVVDLLGVSGRNPNVNFVRTIDVERFWCLIEDALQSFSNAGVTHD
ncbi:MAG: nucleoside hydrolase [Bacillus sp. (in: firmicutes)]